MKKLHLLVSILISFFLYSCISNPLSPEDSSFPVKALVFPYDNSIKKFDVSSQLTTTLYTPGEDNIVSGVGITGNGDMFISEYTYYYVPSVNMYKNRVIKVSGAGNISLVLENEALVDYQISGIAVSPSDRYLALVPSSHSYATITFLNTETNRKSTVEFENYDLGSIDIDITSIVWDEDANSVYIRNDRRWSPFLVKINLETGQHEMMEEVNINLYVENQVLINQGYLKENFDFGKYLDSQDIPDGVKFTPNFNGFLFSGERNLNYCDLESGEIRSIFESPHDAYVSQLMQDMEYIWQDGGQPRNISGDLNYENVYHSYTNADLNKYPGLNSSVRYNVKDSYSIPMLQVFWYNFPADESINFLIRGQLSSLKFNSAETYLIYKTLYNHSYTKADLAISEVKANLSSMQEAIIDYESALDDRTDKFSRLKKLYTVNAFRDVLNESFQKAEKFHNLEKAVLAFLKNQDRNGLIQDVRTLFPYLSSSIIQQKLTNLFDSDASMLQSLHILIEMIQNNEWSSFNANNISMENTLNELNVFLR